MADQPTIPIPTTPPDGYVTQTIQYRWAHPCERYKWLMNLKMSRMEAGGSAKLVRTKSMDNEREVQFYNGADAVTLDRAIADAEDECRALNGLPPLRRRQVIQAGSRWHPTFR